MKKNVILIFLFLFLLSLSGCGNTGTSAASGDEKVLLQSIAHLSKVKSYDLTTSRIESTMFGDKQIMSRKTEEEKIIFEPFVSWSRSDTTSSNIDGTQSRSLIEAYYALNADQLDMYMRSSSYTDPTTGKEPVLGEWKKISAATKEQADWTIDAMKSNFEAQLYLLNSNIDTFKIVKNDKIKDKNLLQYDGYLQQNTILEAYRKYIRNSYVKWGIIKDSNDLSLEGLKKEITGGDILEIKTGIPKLAYSEKPIPVSLWIDKNTFELVRVTVDETSVLQSYMEKEMPKVNADLKPPIVSKALLTYEIKSTDHLKEIPMPD